MEKKPWNQEISVVFAVLTEDQIIGYLAGKIIEQLVKWQRTGKQSDLLDADQYLKRLLAECQAQEDGHGSLARSTKLVSEYFAAKQLKDAEDAEDAEKEETK